MLGANLLLISSLVFNQGPSQSMLALEFNLFPPYSSGDVQALEAKVPAVLSI